MTAARVVLGAGGVLLGLWGVWLIFGSADTADLINIAIWLGAGVLAHDVLIAAITLAVAAVAARLLPEVAKAPVTAALVVVGTVTVVAIPFLGRFGASPTNETLLDRNYVGGYLVLVAIVMVCAAAATVIRMRRPPASGSSPR